MAATCIDSHLHFDSFVEAGTRDEIISEALAAGVNKLVAIGGSDEANRIVLETCAAHPDVVFGVVGFDRDEAGKSFDAEALREQLARPEIVGVGETGIDYHYNADTAPEQKALFTAMLDLAAEFSKPVIVHSREADADTIELLSAYTEKWAASDRAPGVLHCFTGGQVFADRLLDLDFMISFSGIVTFKSAAEIQAVAKTMPLDRMLIETDSPYLAPVPFRGKRNQPAWVVEVARFIAELRGESVEVIMDHTRANTERLFGI